MEEAHEASCLRLYTSSNTLGDPFFSLKEHSREREKLKTEILSDFHGVLVHIQGFWVDLISGRIKRKYKHLLNFFMYDSLYR